MADQIWSIAWSSRVFRHSCAGAHRLHYARVVKRLALVVLVACSHGGPVAATDPQPDAPVVEPSPDGAIDGAIDAAIDAPVSYPNLCAAPIPAGSPMPVQPALPAAGCPTLIPGTTNTITSGSDSRQFILVTPSDFQPDEHLPVIFMWHWLGGSAEDFLTRGDVQNAADQQRFIAVLPVAKGALVFGLNLDTEWPFDITQPQSRVDQETQFFDDMLACVEQQLHVNTSCVSTVGVSAGALFTDELMQARSTTLSSFISMSGGVNDTIIKPWSGAAHAMPGIVMWGGDGPPSMDGDKDILGCLGLGMDFSVASRDLETGLVGNGELLVECRHDCGHVEPPLDTPPGLSKYAAMWQFALDHPFWLAPGVSPYQQTGLPASFPTWCSIGAGNSVGRADAASCPHNSNPCAF